MNAGNGRAAAWEIGARKRAFRRPRLLPVAATKEKCRCKCVFCIYIGTLRFYGICCSVVRLCCAHCPALPRMERDPNERARRRCAAALCAAGESRFVKNALRSAPGCLVSLPDAGTRCAPAFGRGGGVCREVTVPACRCASFCAWSDRWGRRWRRKSSPGPGKRPRERAGR